MDNIDPAIIQRLRTLVLEGRTVPELLRDITAILNLAELNPLLLANYMREAFGLSRIEVKVIGGCSLVGDGELSDSRRNEIMLPNIIAN